MKSLHKNHQLFPNPEVSISENVNESHKTLHSKRQEKIWLETAWEWLVDRECVRALGHPSTLWGNHYITNIQTRIMSILSYRLLLHWFPQQENEDLGDTLFQLHLVSTKWVKSMENIDISFEFSIFHSKGNITCLSGEEEWRCCWYLVRLIQSGSTPNTPQFPIQ